MPDPTRAPVDDVVEKLWPPLPSRDVDARGSEGMRYLALPRAASATVLVPVRPWSAAGAVLRAHRPSPAGSARLTSAIVVGSARLGAARLAARGARSVDLSGRDLSLLRHLQAIVGVPAAMGVHLGPPRANRKAVVQLVNSRGRNVAFAKIGSNALTRSLVRAETQALRRLGTVSFSHLTVPEVIDSDPFRDHEVLVLRPVDTRTRRRGIPDVHTRAMVELSRFEGVTLQSYAATEWWRDVAERANDVGGADGDTIRAAVRSLGSVASRHVVPTGCWHGDWTAWNMAVHGDRAVVWDWERFRRGVPVGWDALHYDVQTAIRRGGVAPRQALASTIDRAGELLAPFGVARTAASAVLVGYLVEMALRYLGDDQRKAGSRLGNIATWLLPELAAAAARLTSGSAP